MRPLGLHPRQIAARDRLAREQRQESRRLGINVGDVTLDYGAAMKRSRAVSAQNSKGVEFLFKKNKITWIKGTAKLAGKNAVTVKTADGKEEKHDAKKARRHLHRLAGEGPAADRPRAEQDDRSLVRRSADAREGAEDDGRSSAPAQSAASSPTSSTPLERRSRSSTSLPAILPLEDADCSAGAERGVQEAEDRRPHRREDQQRQGRRRIP